MQDYDNLDQADKRVQGSGVEDDSDPKRIHPRSPECSSLSPAAKKRRQEEAEKNEGETQIPQVIAGYNFTPENFADLIAKFNALQHGSEGTELRASQPYNTPSENSLPPTLQTASVTRDIGEEGMSIKDISAASEIAARSPFKWRADSNAFEILACIDYIRKMARNAERRLRKPVLIQLLSSTMPQYDTWESSHDLSSISMDQIIELLKDEFCPNSKLRQLLNDPTNDYFKMGAEETIKEFLNRLYRCLLDAPFLAREFSEKWLAGISKLANKETAMRLTTLVSSLKPKLTPLVQEPSKSTLNHDYILIREALDDIYLGESLIPNSPFIPPDAKVVPWLQKAAKKGKVFDVNIVGAVGASLEQGTTEGSQSNKSSGNGTSVQRRSVENPCAFCYKRGFTRNARFHTEEDCRWKKGKDSKKGDTTMVTREDISKSDTAVTNQSDEILCARCLKRGHTSDRCRATTLEIQAVQRAQAFYTGNFKSVPTAELSYKPPPPPATPWVPPVQSSIPPSSWMQQVYGAPFNPYLLPPPSMHQWPWLGTQPVRSIAGDSNGPQAKVKPVSVAAPISMEVSTSADAASSADH